ncbi:hypothetical protein [Aeromicrobium endophyticum]|uniref:Uncharacterized protein n=1 Tax=Aeromicrobium endophyticum TaxID=2292704 RepID=A0A371P3A3_9ACTN|nr:hypothetical protein [Aeromicrobium endophyticum]REK69866.1 hypothetical protein DX116_11790 [Aeromicrobium endophyticum]
MTIDLAGAGDTDGTTVLPGRRRGLPTIALVPLAGVTWWLTGFVWWIVELVGSNIMTVNGYPRAALPLLAASSTDALVVSCVVGGVAAGLVGLLGRGRRVPRLVAVVAGVALALALALVQSRSAFASGGADGQTTDPRVTGGLSVLVVVVTVAAALLGAASLAGRPGRGLALAAAAGAAPLWLFEVVSSLSQTTAFDGSIDGPARWSGAVVLAVGLATIGIRPVVRLALWPVAVLLAWVVAPTATASGYFATSLSRGPRSAALVQEYLSTAGQVWRQAVEPGQRPLAPWIAAIVVAGVLAWVLDRRRPRDEQVDRRDDEPRLHPGPPTLAVPTAEPARSDPSAAAWP